MTTTTRRNIVIIGSSTGGMRMLQRIICDLPKLDAAVVIVQHMPASINDSVREILDRGSEMNVSVAEDGQRLEHGTIYVAPGDMHLQLLFNRRITLFEGEKVNFVRPSVDVTMKSLVKRPNDRFVGIILTGMGRDGAEGIAHIKELGGITMAQDEGSSVIYGMPKEAFETGCVDWVLTPEGIREKLIELLA